MSEKHVAGSPPFIVEERGPVCLIRFNQPDQRNSLTSFVVEQLSDLLLTLRARSDVETILFTGTGDAFAAGANIGELVGLDATAALEFAARGQRLMNLISEAPQLTVAAVNGFCMGGGLDLALACSVRFASPTAVFAHPGARLGIITGWGGTQRLARLVGRTRAFEMFLSARRVNALEALEMRLVSHIDEDVVGFSIKHTGGA